jgi:hypothetical protein
LPGKDGARPALAFSRKNKIKRSLGGASVVLRFELGRPRLLYSQNLP